MNISQLQSLSHLPLTSLSAAPAVFNSPAPVNDEPVTLHDGATFTLSMPTALASGGITIDHETGLIKNVAIMSVGPALGHGFDLDGQSLTTLLSAYKANKNNLKVRFTHPGRASDGIECLMGIPQNFRLEGEIVRGDIQLGQYAKISPKGDLWRYVLAIAKEHPALIGLSIVARFDFERVIDQATGETKQYLGRVKYLQAVDFVGDPAANRNGLLSTPGSTPGQNTGNHPGNNTGEIPNHSLRENTMNPKLRKYLESIGLSASATAAESLAFWQKLSGEQSTQAQALATPAAPAAGNAPGEGTQADANLSTPPAPANTPAPAPAAGSQLSAADVQATVETALAAERLRTNTVYTLASQYNMDQDWINRHVREGTTEAQLNRDVLATIGQRNRPVEGLSGNVTGGEDGRVSLYAGIQDATFLRANLAVEKPHARAREFQHLSAVETGRLWLKSLSVKDVNSFAPEHVAKMCLNRMELAGHIGSIALSHTTSDFPNIYGNVTNRVMTEEYDQEASTWEAWAAERIVNDFRETKLISLGGVPVPSRVREAGEYSYVTMGEKSESIAALKYGLLIAFTWEMFVNDDLSAFTEMAMDFGGACRALENDLAYGQLTANAALNEDSTAVFHANHNNLNEGGEALLSADSISAARAAMRLQRGIAPDAASEGRLLSIMPQVLLVPVALEDKAKQILGSNVDITKYNNSPNYKFLNNLDLVTDPRLDENNAKQWYLAGPTRKRGAVMAFLRNYRKPHIESQAMPINMDGVVYKCRHVTGAKLTDFRPWQTNDGDPQG